MTKVSSSATVNEVFWITSLYDNERGLSSRIVEDLQVYFESIKCRFHQFEPKNAAELLRYLVQLAARARQGSKPIIHLDTHGNATEGLRIAASNEFIPWSRLVEKFRAINVAAGNNVVVVSGACFSAHLLMSLNFYEAVPFYAFFAPDTEVEAGFLESNLRPFYTELLGAADMNAALFHLSPKMKLYHCQALMFRVLAGYVKNYCFGKGGNKRLENLVSTAKDAIWKTGRPLSHWRAFARKHIVPRPQLISDAEITFLIGKPADFTIDQVSKAARESQFDDQRRAVEERRRQKQQQKVGRVAMRPGRGTPARPTP
jgi:hypothetical protein